MMQALKNKKYYYYYINYKKKIFLNCVCCDESQCISKKYAQYTYFFWKSKQTAAVEILVNKSSISKKNLKLYKDNDNKTPPPPFSGTTLTYYYYYYWKKKLVKAKKSLNWQVFVSNILISDNANMYN